MATMTDRMQSQSRTMFWCGIAFLALGLGAVLLPNVATVAVEVLVAWILLLIGGLGLAAAKAFGGAASWRLAIVPAVALVLGLVFLASPGTGATALTILLFVGFVIEGVVSVLFGLAVRRRHARGNWMVVSGAVSLAIALLIVTGWPGTASWVIGLLVGVNFITTGAALVGLAGAVRAVGATLAGGDGPTIEHDPRG